MHRVFFSRWGVCISTSSYVGDMVHLYLIHLANQRSKPLGDASLGLFCLFYSIGVYLCAICTAHQVRRRMWLHIGSNVPLLGRHVSSYHCYSSILGFSQSSKLAHQYLGEKLFMSGFFLLSFANCPCYHIVDSEFESFFVVILFWWHGFDCSILKIIFHIIT